MAIDHDDPSALRNIIAQALAIADKQSDYLVGALLAQCLEELPQPEP